MTVTEAAVGLRDMCLAIEPGQVRGGISEDEVPDIRELFGRAGIPLPEELLDVYRIVSGLGSFTSVDKLLIAPVRRDVVDVTVSFGDLDADIFSLDEIEWVVLGSALSTSLTINREGKVSVEYADYDFEPDGFDYDFGEGFVRFVENVKREFAERLLTKASGYESERLA